MPLKSRMENLCLNCTSLKSRYSRGYSFAAFYMGLFTSSQQAPKNFYAWSIRKPICDFLLVFCCNYMLVFYRFRYITICWSRISVFAPCIPTPFCYKAIAKGVPPASWYESCYQKTKSPSAAEGKNSMILRSLVLSQYHDGRTGKQTYIRKHHVSLSRAVA